MDHPQLRTIEALLDAGNVDDAQLLLADLGDPSELRHATTYLAVRLLYQRGKLSNQDVAERLTDLLSGVHEFPEATAMLRAAETGTLSPSYKPSSASESEAPAQAVSGSTVPPKGSTAPPRAPSSAPPADFALEPSTFSSPPAVLPSHTPTRPGLDLDIPKAPAIPNVAPRSSALPTGAAQANGPKRTSQAPSPARAVSSPPARKPDFSEGLDLDLVPPEPPTGYYSSRPPEVERVRSAHPARTRSQPETRGRRPSSVRARPRVSADETPTLFSVLGLLDDQRFEEALEALERAPTASSPEFVLMRARALLGLNRRDEAVRALRRLCEAPLLEPELRAGCARLLIVADELEMAYQQAQAAYEVDASSPVVRLALAWVAVRMARREEGTERLRLAQTLLETIDVDHGPTPALALGLKACVELDQGEEERALRSARRALDMDANCVDALAALALGSTRVGKRAEAEDAWRRLLRLSSEEAHAVRPLLDRVGTPIDAVRASLAPASSEPTSRRVWDPLESALVNGEPSALQQHWAALCQAELAKLPRASSDQLGWLAERAANLLTRAPGFTHFAPYDYSLWSLLRLQVAIALVYGNHQPDDEQDETSSALVLGAYLGETVRLAHDGYWNGRVDNPETAYVVTKLGDLTPLALLHAHLTSGKKLVLDDYLDLGEAHRGSLPWSRHKRNTSLVPCPWAPMERPEVKHLSPIGRAIGRSMLSLYCDRFADGPLDYTTETLDALESYLALVSPPHSPVDEASPALGRVATLVGCYLGEVLRSLAGGEWVLHGPDPQGYAFCSGSVSVAPIEYVMRRLKGEHALTLAGFVERTSHDLGVA